MKKHLPLCFYSLSPPLIFKKKASNLFSSDKKQNRSIFNSPGQQFAYFSRQLFTNFGQFLILFLFLATAYKADAATGPTITYSGNTSAVNTTYGTASASTSFAVSGSNMSQGILITPPAGLEISTDNATFSSTLTIGTAGNIPSTTVYIRLAASTMVGSYSGDIILSSAGATSVNVSMPLSTVNPATLTITPNDVTKTYGTTLTGGAGSTAFSETGLQNGETIGSVTITYGSGSAGTDGVGVYGYVVSASNPTGGTFNPANYNVNYNYGQITVNPAPLSIIADNVTKTYGQTLTGGAGSKAFTAVGLQNGETIGSVTISYGSGAAANFGVGTYVDCVSVSQGTGGNFSGANYVIIHVSANIIVVAAPLTVTANDVTKTYGEILTDDTQSTAFTVTGLQNGEVIESVGIYYGTGGQAGYPVGACDQCVGIANATGSTFDPNNYSINYVYGNINVTPAALIITADNQLKLYGETNPVLTLTYSGFVNGEGPLQLAAQPIVSTTAGTTSPPGTYPITAEGASDPNYTITYVPGLLTITNSFNIPNAFTPNGDGRNDTWQLEFLNNYQSCTINIFDRQGQRVYYSNGYVMPWDGTYRGSALPTGTYYYVIELKDIRKILSGYVALIR